MRHRRRIRLHGQAVDVVEPVAQPGERQGVGERREGVRARAVVDVRAQRAREVAHEGRLQVVEEVPEEADVELRVAGEFEDALEQRLVGEPTHLVLAPIAGLAVQIGEVQAAAEAAEEAHALGPRRADVEHRQTAAHLQVLEDQRQQLRHDLLASRRRRFLNRGRPCPQRQIHGFTTLRRAAWAVAFRRRRLAPAPWAWPRLRRPDAPRGPRPLRLPAQPCRCCR